MAELDWNALRAFVAVCRAGSLTKAADDLGVSIATVGRAIDRLENTLELKLLKRNASGATPTPAGEAIMTYAEPGARQLSQIMRAAKALRTGPQETPIRITSTEPMIADVLAPRIMALFDDDDAPRIEFDVSTAVSNLNDGEADIAIRLAKPTADTLIARRLPTIDLGLYCTAAYLAGRRPEKIDLASERLLWLDPRYGPIPENAWIAEQRLEAATALRSSSVRAMQRAVEAGAGIAPLPRYSAMQAGLIELPAEDRPRLPSRRPWLAFHRDARGDRRLKRVRDWIIAACRDAYGSENGR